MIFLNVVLPVFLIIALGFGIRRINFVDKFFLDKISHLAYFVAVPSLLVWKIGKPPNLGDKKRSEFLLIIVVPFYSYYPFFSTARNRITENTPKNTITIQRFKFSILCIVSFHKSPHLSTRSFRKVYASA
jgi:predicted permease